MLVFPWFQKPKDLLQMMLNAHNDKDVNDDEAVHQYEKDPEKWKKRGMSICNTFTIYTQIFKISNNFY